MKIGIEFMGKRFIDIADNTFKFGKVLDSKVN